MRDLLSINEGLRTSFSLQWKRVRSYANIKRQLLTLGEETPDGQEGKMKRGLIAFMWVLLVLCVPLLSNAGGIQWQSYKDGMAKGKSEHRKIFVNFHADW
jgi:hypothetical protein